VSTKTYADREEQLFAHSATTSRAFSKTFNSGEAPLNQFFLRLSEQNEKIDRDSILFASQKQAVALTRTVPPLPRPICSGNSCSTATRRPHLSFDDQSRLRGLRRVTLDAIPFDDDADSFPTVRDPRTAR